MEVQPVDKDSMAIDGQVHYTLSEFARRAGAYPARISTLVHKKESKHALAAVWLCGRPYIPHSELLRYIEERAEK